MLPIYISLVLSLLLFTICRWFLCKSGSHPKWLMGVLFGGAFLLRLILAYVTEGHTTDLNCFGAWAQRIYALGPSNFYAPDTFTDYPPGYLYLLEPIGALTRLFDLEYLSACHKLLLKLPAILCDMASGYLLYKEAGRRTSQSQALCLASLFLYCPAIILNSAIWGQVDSILTLCLLIMCLGLMHQKLLPAYISFGIGMLIKPQMLVFTPVLLVGMIDLIFLQDFSDKNFSNMNFSYKKLLKNMGQIVGVILLLFFLCLPFGLTNVISQYTDTLGSYPYASVNAYNLYTLLGLNWAPQSQTLGGIPLTFIGYLVILLIVIVCLYVGLSLRDYPAKYPLLSAFCVMTMFTFSIRMHERYLYPALLCLLLAYAVCQRQSIYLCCGLFSALHLLNTAHILWVYDPYHYDGKAPILKLVSLGMVIGAIGFYVALYRIWKEIQKGQTAVKKGTAPSLLHTLRLTRQDLCLMFGIMVFYSLFALHDLGDAKAPTSIHSMNAGETLDFTFHEGEVPATLTYYIAPWHNRRFQLEYVDSSTNEICLSNVFTWEKIDLATGNPMENSAPPHIRMTLIDTDASIIEFRFADALGNVLTPVNASEYPALFDESHLYPGRYSHQNSMYFDEIYHARTAYEFENHLTSYENTHPPLGKFFISTGIKLFGMNPFGWRIAGTVFGILMLPLLYLFAKKITGHTALSAFASFLFAFDFMHFTQTRIATIDVFVTFFIILMYYLMYCYWKEVLPSKRRAVMANSASAGSASTGSVTGKSYFLLGACGISMGLGVSCKWTGAYAGVGLAIIFFAILFLQIRRKQLRRPAVTKLIGFCMVFFVVLPIAIYVLSYLPFKGYTEEGYFAKVWNNQVSMLSYHGNLNATHPFSSPWYQWPILKMPVWYYSAVVSDTVREGISAFGNPLVWWIGIPAFLYTVYLAIKKKDTTAAFLLVGYLSQYLPWVFVTRITFIYHYFTSVPFVVLMIMYSLMQLKAKLSDKSFTILLVTYAGLSFGLFLLFYPVLSGQPVEIAFVDKYLRWFDSWVLIAG